MNIIGILHILIFGILISFYALIFKKNYIMDIIYLLYIIFLLFYCIIYDNECIITYYYNKFYKKDDVLEMIESDNLFFKISFVILTLAIIYSIFTASIRSNILSFKMVLLFLFIRFFYLFFNNAVGYNFKSVFAFLFSLNLYNNIVKLYNLKQIHCFMSQYINKIIFIINLYIFLHLLYTNKNKI